MRLTKWVIGGVILLVILPSFLLWEGTRAAEYSSENLYSSLGIQRINPPLEAIDFTLENLQGSQVSLADFEGKVIFLNFWATWCPPCRIEMPDMEKLWQKFKDEDFVILAVDLRERKDKVSSFVKENGYTFPVLLDSGGEVANTYGITAIPTTYLLDPRGRIVGKALGARHWASDDAFKLIEHLLPKSR